MGSKPSSIGNSNVHHDQSYNSHHQPIGMSASFIQYTTDYHSAEQVVTYDLAPKWKSKRLDVNKQHQSVHPMKANDPGSSMESLSGDEEKVEVPTETNTISPNPLIRRKNRFSCQSGLFGTIPLQSNELQRVPRKIRQATEIVLKGILKSDRSAAADIKKVRFISLPKKKRIIDNTKEILQQVTIRNVQINSSRLVFKQRRQAL